MYPVLCPRCGIGVSYFRKDRVGPYCGECGWNLEWVSQVSRKPDWFFLKAILACILLIAISALMHAISWRGASFLCGTFCAMTLLTFFGATKERRRAENLVNTVAQKQGADL